MGKKPKQPTLYDLSRQFLHPTDEDAHMRELHEASDRAAALVGGAMVDMGLVGALSTNMLIWSEKAEAAIFFDPSAPLGTFAGRTIMGRALGIYGAKVHAQLDAVRAVRNAFAHAIKPLTFAIPEVARECAKLQDVKVFYRFNPMVDPARDRFLANCLMMQEMFHHYHRTLRMGGGVFPFP